MMDRIELLGVQIDNVTAAEALDRIREMAASGKPHQIVTPAIEQIIRCRKDEEFNRVLKDAELVVADGMHLIFASRWSRTPLKERITGADSLPALCEMAAKEGFSVFFMGGEEGVADETVRILKQQYPALQVAGIYSPPYRFEFDPEEEKKAIEIIQKAKPDILFLAISSPRAEKWLHKKKIEINVPVSMAIGGAFNFITGKEKRAPKWLQDFGMEWLYRAIQRPGDIWQRIILNAPYFFWLFFDLLSYRIQKRIAYWIRPVFLAGSDALFSAVSFLFSYWLYFRSGLFSTTADPFPLVHSLLKMPAYSHLLGFVALFGVFSMGFFRMYERDKYSTYRAILFRVLQSSLTTVLLLICFQFIFFKNLLKEYQFLGYSRVVFGFYGISLLGFWSVWRIFFHWFEHALHRAGINLDRIIVIGVNNAAQRITDELNKYPELGIIPLGYIQTGEPCSGIVHSSILGTISDLRRLLPARKVDEILIADSSLPMKELLEIIKICQQYSVKISIIPTIHEILGVSSEIKRIGNFRVITINPDTNAEELLRDQGNAS